MNVLRLRRLLLLCAVLGVLLASVPVLIRSVRLRNGVSVEGITWNDRVLRADPTLKVLASESQSNCYAAVYRKSNSVLCIVFLKNDEVADDESWSFHVCDVNSNALDTPILGSLTNSIIHRSMFGMSKVKTDELLGFYVGVEDTAVAGAFATLSVSKASGQERQRFHLALPKGNRGTGP